MAFLSYPFYRPLGKLRSVESACSRRSRSVNARSFSRLSSKRSREERRVRGLFMAINQMLGIAFKKKGENKKELRRMGLEEDDEEEEDEDEEMKGKTIEEKLAILEKSDQSDLDRIR